MARTSPPNSLSSREGFFSQAARAWRGFTAPWAAACRPEWSARDLHPTAARQPAAARQGLPDLLDDYGPRRTGWRARWATCPQAEERLSGRGARRQRLPPGGGARRAGG